MNIYLNNKTHKARSEVEISMYLDTINSIKHVEAWVISSTQTSLCLLKNNKHTLLMYLKAPEDICLVSDSNLQTDDMIEFHLANGQVDEYPLSWCIEPESAYRALAYFLENSGEQSPYINWQES